MSFIASQDLRLHDVPFEDAAIHDIMLFAHTFNGYACWGSFERCAEIADAQDHSSLETLRTCLFFEARRWRHVGEDPDVEAEAYWRSVIAKIRAAVQQRDR